MRYSYRLFIFVLLLLATPTIYADMKIHCHGIGPRIYLIGGGPAFTTWNLQPVQDKLSTRYQVCRWDMRGVGDNYTEPLANDKTALSQWLADMQTILPAEPVILWGHSWGALQVLLFTKQSPQRVSKIILSNPVDPDLQSLAHIEQKRFHHHDLEHPLALDDMDTGIEELHILRGKIASYFANAKQGWEYAQRFDQRDANKELNVRIWDEYRRNPLNVKDLQQLASKVSGVIYCRDDVLQPENEHEYRRLLPQTRHYVLTGCAHFPWEENAGDYYRTLLKIIKARQ